MAVQAAAGVPQLSGTFIPEIWAGKLVNKFYGATVFGALANTDYEGIISQMGDKVQIRTTPDITIRDYQKGQTLETEMPNSPNVELAIDRAKYFQFAVDSIDKRQSDISYIENWSNDAAEKMKKVIDRDILGTIYADADAFNKGDKAGAISQDINLGKTGAPLQITKANIIDFIVDMSVVADEADWPEEDRGLVLPSWMGGMLKKSDLKDASITGDGTSVLRNGRIGMIDRWEVFLSNNVANVLDGVVRAHHIIGAQKSALTFASQMTEMDTLKSEKTFGELVRGLNVYGFKSLNGKGLIDGYVYK